VLSSVSKKSLNATRNRRKSLYAFKLYANIAWYRFAPDCHESVDELLILTFCPGICWRAGPIAAVIFLYLGDYYQSSQRRDNVARGSIELDPAALADH